MSSTRSRWVVCVMPRPLYLQGTGLLFQLGRRLGGPHNWSECREVKVKLFLSHHECIRGSRNIAPLILTLGTRWRWAVNFTPLLLYCLYLLNRRLAWFQSWSWTFLEKRKTPCPCQIVNPALSNPWASHCTDWAIVASLSVVVKKICASATNWIHFYDCPTCKLVPDWNVVKQ